jgi:hypothetical protein
MLPAEQTSSMEKYQILQLWLGMYQYKIGSGRETFGLDTSLGGFRAQ